MSERRHFLQVAIATVVGATLMPEGAAAERYPSAAARMNELGPENRAMAKRAGLWSVTETVWGLPGAAPITTTGLVAERKMMGSMLQEILRPTTDLSGTAIDRIDYLTFNRVEGRWEYVSMDLRAAVGIMTAQSLTRGDEAKIDVTFAPFAVAGAGASVAGQMLRMHQVIVRIDVDRDTKDQYFEMADGAATMWLAHRYAYRRQA